MHIAFLNIQGNFDPLDRCWTAHPDFGGQLVYVKEVALALGRMGHKVDIVTRQIRDRDWPGFELDEDGYPGEPNVRILRIPCGGDGFLRKEDLWPFIGTEWVPNIMDRYAREGTTPDAATAHYGDAGIAAALWLKKGGPAYTFTAHSLGAQKLERLLIFKYKDIHELDVEFYFARRIAAERAAMNHAACIITSTSQERLEQYGHAAYADACNPEDRSRFVVIPPGVNLHIFDKDVRGPDDEHVAAHLESLLARDLDTGRLDLPLIICSSRLAPKKNHIGLVLAYARSRELQRHANLLLVMHGLEDLRHGMHLSKEQQPILDEVIGTCEAADLWGKVCGCSLENQTELAAAYRHLARRRSVFVLPSLYEPFGLAPLEAIAAGVPACVTQAGGPSESLCDEETGTEYAVLVDPADPAAIARGLLRLVGPRNAWQHFRDVGRRRVLARYTWEATAGGYIETLERIGGRNDRRGRLSIAPYFSDPSPENDVDGSFLSQTFAPTAT